MELLNFTIKGVTPLLQNNPQGVDPFNPYTQAKKVITNKRKKTDEDQLELRRLDVESKVYFDDELGIYVPASWISAAIAGCSWNKAKIKKAEIRSGVFPTESRLKLHFRDRKKVKSKADVSGNSDFIETMLLKQGQVKIAKCAPIFNDWHFDAAVEFDPLVIDRSTLLDLFDYASNYGGFGDFRPTFGRARFVAH